MVVLATCGGMLRMRTKQRAAGLRMRIGRDANLVRASRREVVRLVRVIGSGTRTRPRIPGPRLRSSSRVVLVRV